MKENKWRARKIGLLLYNDDETHIKALDKLITEYEVAYIIHDKDVDEQGNLKKPHIHVFLSLANAQWNTALAKDLGITPNYMQQLRNEDNALEYLIHLNDKDKYQYDLEDVRGSAKLKKRLIAQINKDDKSEGEKVIELISFIESHNGYLTVTSFAKWCAEQGYWDVFRRSGSIMINILKEHNLQYIDDPKNGNN